MVSRPGTAEVMRGYLPFEALYDKITENMNWEENKVNKAELVAAAAEESGMTKKDAEKVIDATLAAITGELKNGGKVQLTGFGSFEVKERAARTGRNPRTKETIEIAATKVPVFKAGKSLKDVVAG